MTRPNPFLELRQELPIIFWPILYWSLKWFIRYVAELRAAGHEHIRWHVMWYGKIKVTWVDAVDPFAKLKALPSLDDLQARYLSTPWTAHVGRDTIPPCHAADSAWRDGIPPYKAWGACGKKLKPG